MPTVTTAAAASPITHPESSDEDSEDSNDAFVVPSTKLAAVEQKIPVVRPGIEVQYSSKVFAARDDTDELATVVQVRAGKGCAITLSSGYTCV